MSVAFNNDNEILELVRRFESCEMHPADFRHYQHLTVALWYLRQSPYETASERMRAGIQKLATAYGKTGYHETINLFWLMVVRDFVAANDCAESICESANRLVAMYDKNFINEFYSAELL